MLEVWSQLFSASLLHVYLRVMGNVAITLSELRMVAVVFASMSMHARLCLKRTEKHNKMSHRVDQINTSFYCSHQTQSPSEASRSLPHSMIVERDFVVRQKIYGTE